MASDRPKKIAVIGAAGAIGNALVHQLASSENQITPLSRNRPSNLPNNAIWKQLDIFNEDSLEQVATQNDQNESWDLVIIATGILHNKHIQPEKDWKQISTASMEEVMRINAIGPALCIKYFAPYLSKDRQSIMVAISARVGSISDNRLGGWYSYRASKAALNQIIKTASIELARKNKLAIIAGLHPGTVETELSAPFTANAYDRFSPEQSAIYLLDVISNLRIEQSGNVYDWQGERIDE